MRLQLHLTHAANSILPINYQHFISAFIYRTLAKSAPAFADWLHDKGFEKDGKHYKLFTFDKIRSKPFKIDKERQLLLLEGNQSQLLLSFWVNDALQHFVRGLFEKQSFYLGDNFVGTHFQVNQIDILSTPTFQASMRWKLLTPSCISTQREGLKHAQYLAPTDPAYSKLLHQHLLRKFASMEVVSPEINSANFQIKTLGGIHSKLQHIKNGIKVRGYEYSFELIAHPGLQEAAYFAGLGEKNAQGFGLITPV